jgi:hypothetical protein
MKSHLIQMAILTTQTVVLNQIYGDIAMMKSDVEYVGVVGQRRSRQITRPTGC